MHQGSAGIGGTAIDIEIQAENLEHTKNVMMRPDRRAHRPAGGDDRAGLPAGPVVHRRGGARLRLRRPGAHRRRRRSRRTRPRQRVVRDGDGAHEPATRSPASSRRPCAGRAGRRHLQPAADRPDRLHRHRDRRRGRQRGDRPAAAPGVGRARTSPIDLYLNSPGGSVTAMLGDLRHDAVHQLAGRHDGDRPGRLVGRRAAGGGGARVGGWCSRTRGWSCTSPPAAARARCPTSPCRPRRSCGCARRWRRSWPGTPAATREVIREDTERDLVLSAHEAVDYGLADAILDTRKGQPLNST